jgi:Domain of unknown function (DUF4136)
VRRNEVVVMRFVPLSLTGLALLMVACATGGTVDKFEAPEAGLAARRTYAWTKGEFGTPNEVDPAVLARADRAMRSAIDKELARKGYVAVPDASQADMHVSYQVAGQRRFVIADDQPVGASAATEAMTPGRQPAPPPSSQLPSEQTVRDGTVIVFIDDPATKRLIWRGLINAETRVATTEGAIEQASNMARQIAREIPVRSN